MNSDNTLASPYAAANGEHFLRSVYGVDVRRSRDHRAHGIVRGDLSSDRHRRRDNVSFWGLIIAQLGIVVTLSARVRGCRIDASLLFSSTPR